MFYSFCWDKEHEKVSWMGSFKLRINLAIFARKNQEVKFVPRIRFEKGKQVPTFGGSIGHGATFSDVVSSRINNSSSLPLLSISFIKLSSLGEYDLLISDVDGLLKSFMSMRRMFGILYLYLLFLVSFSSGY